MKTKEARRIGLKVLYDVLLDSYGGYKVYSDCDIWGKMAGIQYGKRRGWFEIKSSKDAYYGHNITKVICTKRAYSVLYLEHKKLQGV